MDNETYPAYTQSHLQKWLRDIHHILISIDHRQVSHNVFEYRPWVYSNLVVEETYTEDDVFTKYEDALEDALYDALLLIP